MSKYIPDWTEDERTRRYLDQRDKECLNNEEGKAMGYSTIEIDKKVALELVKSVPVDVDSASDVELFERFPSINEIVSACKSDHGHVIFNLRDLHFVDYKIRKDN